MTDVEYGVNVSNKYSMFYDEDHDPNEFIAQQLVTTATRKSAEEKAAKKKEKKAAAIQQAAPAPAAPEKKIVTAQSGPKQAVTDATKPGGGRPFDSKQPAARDREEKENKPARQFGGDTHRGSSGFGGGRPPRGDRLPRQQDRSNLPPRMGGGFNSGTGGENQQFDQGFHQHEDRGGFGRGRGGRRGFGGRGRGSRGGGFNQGDDSGGGSFGFNAVDNSHGFGSGSGNEGGGFGTFGDDTSGGGFGGGSDRPFRGRGRGRGRGGGGGRGFGRGRQFDRASGSDRTGVKPVDKRDGSGPYNWGSQHDAAGESEGFNAANPPAEGQQPPPEAGDEEKRASGDEQQEADEAAKEAEEAAQRELTLDEWKARQMPKSKPSFNIRQAGEGEGDKTEWKKLIPLARPDPASKKNADESYEDEEEGEDAHQKKKAKEIPIEINFIDNNAGFTRGTRARGGRGGRGRGGQRGGDSEGYPARRGFGSGARGGSERGFGGRGGGGFGAGGGFGGGGGGGGGFGGFGGGQSDGGGGGRGRGGGRRDVPYKMDEESFPQLSSSAAA